MTDKTIIEEFEGELNIKSVEYSNIGGFGWKDQVQHDKKELLELVGRVLKQVREEEYKRGHNDCLRELGKTGEKWQGNYL